MEVHTGEYNPITDPKRDNGFTSYSGYRLGCFVRPDPGVRVQRSELELVRDRRLRWQLRRVHRVLQRVGRVRDDVQQLGGLDGDRIGRVAERQRLGKLWILFEQLGESRLLVQRLGGLG
jgi:hypothetical protein